MSELLTSTRLWQRAFASDCKHAKSLEQSLLQARKSVGELIAGIPGDMKGFTIHDLTHLDALWEIADLLAGDSMVLNPAEAYVFGLAVLLHDAGMTLMAYPRGLAELEQTREWSEEARSLGVAELVTSEIPAQQFGVLVTNVLRRLHAEKAEMLAVQAWTLEHTQLHLIHDDELRAHYGALAGRIAHSHHWDSGLLRQRFPTALGTFGEFPQHWTVEPLKIATLLRCADAAHIDHRRAPRLTFAMTNPQGISRTHWSFQAKLAKPYIKDGRLCYTSRSPFGRDEVDAWYLCFDTARMVDKELSEAEDNLRELATHLSVDGVCGVKTVGAFAEFIATKDWKPVAVDIQVSDVPSLARSLGGTSLYSNFFAPLREMLQNSADAIDARCAVENGFSKQDGLITVRVRPEGEAWRLDVEDNGIGMSERVMTRALLDFGKSFWRSELIQQEYPEAHARFANSRGRFGIGFFSIFMWADQVTVTSRRFGDGVAETTALEFKQGIGCRPIIRESEARERSTSVSTRVSLIISEETASKLLHKQQDSQDAKRIRVNRHDSLSGDFLPVELIVAALDIRVVLDSENGSRQINRPDWKKLSDSEFIEYFSKFCGSVKDTARTAEQVSQFVLDGVVRGRGLMLPPFLTNERPSILVHEKGITIGRSPGRSIFAVIDSRALNAARDKFDTDSATGNESWLAEQEQLIFLSADDDSKELAAQQVLIQRGRFSRGRKMFILNRSVCSLNDVLNHVAKSRKVSLRFKVDYNDSVIWKEADSLSTLLGLDIDTTRLFTLCNMPVCSGDGSSVKRVVSGEIDSGVLSEILSDIRRVLGPQLDIVVREIDRDSYSKNKDFIVELSAP